MEIQDIYIWNNNAALSLFHFTTETAALGPQHVSQNPSFSQNAPALSLNKERAIQSLDGHQSAICRHDQQTSKTCRATSCYFRLWMHKHWLWVIYVIAQGATGREHYYKSFLLFGSSLHVFDQTGDTINQLFPTMISKHLKRAELPASTLALHKHWLYPGYPNYGNVCYTLEQLVEKGNIKIAFLLFGFSLLVLITTLF